MKNQILADMFARIADILEIQGESHFKVNAYRRAVRMLEEMPDDVAKIWEAGTLRDIPGFGDALVKKIGEYLTTGRMKKYDELMASPAAKLVDLLSIQNLGPKTVALMHKQFNVQSVDDVIQLLEDGRLATLPGMGEKKLENIRRGIAHFQAGQERITIGHADVILSPILETLKQRLGNAEITVAGSRRRMKATIGDLDVLVATDNGAEVVHTFVNLPQAIEVLAAGDTKGSIRTDAGVQVDLRAVRPAEFGAALQYFTGSKAHNVKLRGIARKMGMKINEYGVFSGNELIAGANEADVYAALGLPLIAPELREDRGEIEAALDSGLPELITRDDVRGDLHVHSTYSDGHLELAQVAEIARKSGYEYIAICDHSAVATYANGLTPERLRQQSDEIDAMNKRFPDLTMLKGSEVDILPDGMLNFPDEVLATLDIVVASIHSAFSKNVTERILAALENPYVDIIAHPTGVLYSKRDAYDVDLEKVMAKAAETGTALEINGHPMRLDLSDIHARQAIGRGVKLAINTDAHRTRHYNNMQYGIGTARRAWVTAEDVINTMTLDELRRWQKVRLRTKNHN